MNIKNISTYAFVSHVILFVGRYYIQNYVPIKIGQLVFYCHHHVILHLADEG